MERDSYFGIHAGHIKKLKLACQRASVSQLNIKGDLLVATSPCARSVSLQGGR